jgi:hypothetical protein
MSRLAIALTSSSPPLAKPQRVNEEADPDSLKVERVVANTSATNNSAMPRDVFPSQANFDRRDVPNRLGTREVCLASSRLMIAVAVR